MISLVKFVIFLSLVEACLGGRRLNALVQQSPLVLSYHKGALLAGTLPINVVWYGQFSAAQRSIVGDFLSSLDQQNQEKSPSVSSWWKIVEEYLVKAGKPGISTILLGKQVLDEKYLLGKSLKRTQIGDLAAKAATPNSITIVLTSKDVAVEGFCMSSCGLHDSAPLAKGLKEEFAYIWVGNSETQCPGQCAWPFHQPLYGPQTPPRLPHPWKQHPHAQGCMARTHIQATQGIYWWIRALVRATMRMGSMGGDICCQHCGIP